MANREVILKEKIEGLGAEADVVTVKAGFASNFLIPQGKAYRANKANLRHLEALKRKRAEREAQELSDAQAIASKVRKIKITLELATGKAGKAFGSVTTMDIARALEEKGLKIDRHSIDLAKPIKHTGDFDVPIKLHPEVTADLKLWVKAKASEEPEETAASESARGREEEGGAAQEES